MLDRFRPQHNSDEKRPSTNVKDPKVNTDSATPADNPGWENPEYWEPYMAAALQEYWLVYEAPTHDESLDEVAKTGEGTSKFWILTADHIYSDSAAHGAWWKPAFGIPSLIRRGCIVSTATGDYVVDSVTYGGYATAQPEPDSAGNGEYLKVDGVIVVKFEGHLVGSDVIEVIDATGIIDVISWPSW